ncbi:sodium/potassium/calcium exchanger 5-like [Centruroides vittatus]|uniref:sodium/potassium/calcium exchanger 5-like n=1 Tax=Centruroides vittatus TaxID=120091 RepID=UPI00351099CB
MFRTKNFKKNKLDQRHKRFLWFLPCLIIFCATINKLFRNSLEGNLYKSTDNELQYKDYSSRKMLQSVNTTEDCLPPSLEQFPDDFFTNEERLKGGIVVHFLLVIYFCSMLAIICDSYFVPSLEIIADYFSVPADVAGATFMAIGTSSPELFSSIIGSFVTEGDIGIGTIVGSAVFNILGVASMTGIIVGSKDIPVDWYPITRDCFMYCLTVSALIVIINNNIVTWWEALIMLLMYVFYILIMYFNTRIEGFCTLKVEKIQKWLHKGKPIDEHTPLLGNRHFRPEIIIDPPKQPQYDGPLLCTDDEYSIEEEIVSRRTRRESKLLTESIKELEIIKQEEGLLFSMPKGNIGIQVWWVLMWPATLIFSLTIIDCRKPRFRKFFPATFFSSVIWLAIISYLTIWMVTIISYTLRIPDTVAGITLLAAGTSIPEIISSIIVIKNGLGNMAICNLLGSNIFDILFCLGAPWLVKTAGFSNGDGFLIINSSALTYTVTTLLTTIIMLYMSLYITQWKLNWKLGIMCLILYSIFLVLACLYELNIFGYFNPVTCLS